MENLEGIRACAGVYLSYLLLEEKTFWRVFYASGYQLCVNISLIRMSVIRLFYNRVF